MNWLSFIWLLLKVANALLDFAKTRKQVSDAEAAIVARALKDSIDALDRANKSRADAERKFDESGGVPDDNDPNLRD